MTSSPAATLDVPSSNINDFLDWWVVLHSLLNARAVHTAGDVHSPTMTAAGSTSSTRSGSTTIRPS